MAWHVRSCSESPHGSVILKPDPGRFWREVVLVVIVAAANVALFVIGSRGLSIPRRLTIGISAAAVAASTVVIASAGATAGDNMEVAGRMSHGANLMYFVASLVIVLLGPITAVAQPFYWRLPREARPRLRRRAAPTEAGSGDGVR
jgi:Kef-type K+ transport system membrane component KefB